MKDNNIYKEIDLNMLSNQLLLTYIEKEEHYILPSRCYTAVTEFIYDIIIENKDKILEYDYNVLLTKIPNITLDNFIKRLTYSYKLEENELIFLAVLIKLISDNKIFKITLNNIYSLISSALMITEKYLRDKQQSISYLSKCTSMDKEMLCFNENAILEMIGFCLFDIDNNFTQYKQVILDLYSDVITQN